MALQNKSENSLVIHLSVESLNKYNFYCSEQQNVLNWEID